MLSPGTRPAATSIRYDHLVIPMGTRLDHSKIPGMREHAHPFKYIVASFRGTPKKIFAFTGLGKLGSLGRRSAVAEMFGIHLKGLIAWLFWRGVYVTKFPGLDGQVRLIADWFLKLSCRATSPSSGSFMGKTCIGNISRQVKRCSVPVILATKSTSW